MMNNEATELLIRCFTQEVTEIASGSIEIKAAVRKPGHRCKLAVLSHDPDMDAVKVCTGEGSSHVRRILDRLNHECIDLFLWSDSPEELIKRALQPAFVPQVALYHAQHRALVRVEDEEQLAIAEGHGGINRELASQLSGWDIQVAISRTE